MEVSYVVFDRLVHTIIYGVKHRGFTDPGLRSNNGRFNGILTRLTLSVREMMDRCRVGNILRNTGVPPHLVQATVERADVIDWDLLSDNAYTEGGRYLRYTSETVEVDRIPIRYDWANLHLARLGQTMVRFTEHAGFVK